MEVKVWTKITKKSKLFGLELYKETEEDKVRLTSRTSTYSKYLFGLRFWSKSITVGCTIKEISNVSK